MLHILRHFSDLDLSIIDSKWLIGIGSKLRLQNDIHGVYHTQRNLQHDGNLKRNQNINFSYQHSNNIIDGDNSLIIFSFYETVLSTEKIQNSSDQNIIIIDQLLLVLLLFQIYLQLNLKIGKYSFTKLITIFMTLVN